MTSVEFKNNPKAAAKRKKYKPVQTDVAKQQLTQTQSLKNMEVFRFNRRREMTSEGIK